MNQPSHGQFDPLTKTFFNSNTGKWVQKLRPSTKGLTKGNTYLKKYNELGKPQKFLQIPINTDIELIQSEANRRGLNYEYCLFILHKLLYNRARLRKSSINSSDYYNNFTPLGSKDIYKWIGTKYVDYIRLLIDIKYLNPKLSSKGNWSYWNGANPKGASKQTACFQINPELFNKDLFEYRPTFKTVSLLDIKLIVKLHLRHLNDYTSGDTVSILQNALRNVRIQCDVKYLNKHFLPDVVEDVLHLINDINNGCIYVRSELDSFGERFHSSFTFTWSSLRPLIYFDNSISNLIYLDLSNSQYFFFSLLSYENVYKELIPEYASLKEIIDKFVNDESFKTFSFHAQNATLYHYLEKTYGLKKLDLMKLFFAKSNHYKKIRVTNFPWLQSVIETMEIKFGHNVLPEVLQKLESRNVLLRVCVPFIVKNDANLISIHDGILFESSFYKEVIDQLNLSFTELNLPIPKFKIVRYVHPRLKEEELVKGTTRL